MKEHIKKLRDEIAELLEADGDYVPRANHVGASEHERRLERVQAILDELKSLTDWKKT